MTTYLPALLIAISLTACGGGGSSNTPSPPPAAPAPTATPPPTPTPTPAPATSAVAFTPGTLVAAITAGTSKQLTVTASILRPSDFDGATVVYAYIIDDVGVILPNANVAQTGPTQFTATLITSSTLAAGSYNGNLMLKLCRDAACATQFPGSPSPLPYALTVTKP